MTEQHDSTPESPIEASAKTYESLLKALGGLENKFEIPQATREFVKRSAAAAKDRSTDLHVGAQKMNGAIEAVLLSAVNTMADVNRRIVDAAYQDAEASLAAIDRLAGATSLAEAYQVSADYLRQQREVGVARAKSAGEFVSTKTSESFQALQDRFAKVMPTKSQVA
jgi:hypothetical protein